MLIGRIVGELVATHKHPSHEGCKILLVQPLNLDGSNRGDPVVAKDGPIGRVQGLVIDPADHHVTHVLLDEGHLWGAKRVAIPIGAVAEVNDADGVCVSLTKDEVRDLPPVDLEEPDEG